MGTQVGRTTAAFSGAGWIKAQPALTGHSEPTRRACDTDAQAEVRRCASTANTPGA